MAWTSTPTAVFIYAKYNNYDILIVSAHYGMDKYAYCCGLSSCDREAVCLRYIKATLKSDNQTIAVERYGMAHQVSMLLKITSFC